MKNIFNKIKSLFKNNNSFIISLREYGEYCKNHALLITITIAIIILSHGMNIFYNNLGIDSQVFVQYPTFNYNWIGLGRFGLLLERNILYLNPFVSYYAGILMIVFLILACTIMFYSFYKISGKDFGYAYLCIPLLCFTHPVFVEQFLFKLQCAEIAFATFLVALSTLWIFTWIKSNNYKYAVLGIIGLIISFASYQSFVFIYITMCIFSFILLNEDGEKRSNIIIIIKLISSFFIAYLLYQLIIRFAFLYTGFEIHWGKASKREIFRIIIGHIKNVLIGLGPHYNLGYTCGLFGCLGILIYNFIKSNNTKSNKIWYALSFGMLFASPFFLAIVIGDTPLLRAQLALPYCETFLIMLVTYYLFNVFNKKYLMYIPIIIIFCVVGAQLSITETFYYTDNYKNDFEIQISNQIIHDLKEKGIEERSTIAIIGYKNPPFNKLCRTGEIVGLSSYNANYYACPYYVYSTANILGLWHCLGYEYMGCSAEQAEKARKLVEEEDIPSWPQEGSIVKYEDFYILKLSEDELPW